MPLWDSPPGQTFSVDVYYPTSTQDAGGGTSLSYTLRTAGVLGILNSASSSEKEMFAQMGMTVSHTFVHYGTTTAQRGDKLLYSGRSLHVVGINVNEAMGTIPTLSKLVLNEILG